MLCSIAPWDGFGDAIALSIRHLRNERGTGDELCPASVSGVVTEHAPVSYWPIFFPVPSNGPRSL